MTPQELSVPFGFCHCNCGGKTPIASRNRASVRMVKGQPMRFIVGHRVRPKQPEEAKPFKIDGEYCRLIPLTKGFYAIVWETDYAWLMRLCSWQVARSRDSGGYYATDRGRRKMHQLLSQCVEGEEPDHRNGNSLDNRRSNLRACPHGKNTKNAARRKDNQTGFKGVYRKGKKFAAGLQSDKVKYFFGTYDTAVEAALAYDDGAIQHHGEFARLNFPRSKS